MPQEISGGLDRHGAVKEESFAATLRSRVMVAAAGPTRRMRSNTVVGLGGSSAGARPLPVTDTNRAYSTGVH